MHCERVEEQRRINAVATIAAQSREAEAREEVTRLRNALISSWNEKSKLEGQLTQQELEHKSKLEEQERFRRGEVTSLKEEIGELKVELARAEVRADQQRRARKLDYLSILESKLKELEDR